MGVSARAPQKKCSKSVRALWVSSSRPVKHIHTHPGLVPHRDWLGLLPPEASPCDRLEKKAGRPLGARGWTAGSEAASAYLIRSRPSGRKINSRACCYCRARGRAVTRAQHSVYTAVHTHTHSSRHTNIWQRTHLLSLMAAQTLGHIQ